MTVAVLHSRPTSSAVPMSKTSTLAETEAVRLFADAYTSSGNAAAAYRASHPRCKSARAAEACGSRMLRSAKVLAAIERRRKHSDKKAIATRSERQQFWTDVSNDKDQSMQNRLRASELLGKSQADFVEVRVAPIVTDMQASEEELIDQVGNILDKLQRRLAGQDVRR